MSCCSISDPPCTWDTAEVFLGRIQQNGLRNGTKDLMAIENSPFLGPTGRDNRLNQTFLGWNVVEPMALLRYYF